MPVVISPQSLVRPFFAVIAIVATGYLGWVGYQEWQSTNAFGFRSFGSPETSVTPAAIPPPPQPLPTAPAPAATNLPTTAPGVFYATERVARQTETGVKALLPGEQVKLMYRYKNGTMLVTNGQDEFVVKPSSLSKERPSARSLTPPRP